MYDVGRQPTSTNLIALEVGSSAGGKALFTAEALELRAHAERVAFHPFLLAPDAHYLHILYVIHWSKARQKQNQGASAIKNDATAQGLSSARASVAVKIEKFFDVETEC